MMGTRNDMRPFEARAGLIPPPAHPSPILPRLTRLTLQHLPCARGTFHPTPVHPRAPAATFFLFVFFTSCSTSGNGHRQERQGWAARGAQGDPSNPVPVLIRPHQTSYDGRGKAREEHVRRKKQGASLPSHHCLVPRTRTSTEEKM